MLRNDQIQQLKIIPLWDFIIIGGGATGLGTALDAASRGYKTLCIEKSDFSKGTSSRSTKLIHGGVRYLKQGNISIVKSALTERWFFMKNASSATAKLPFILPVYGWWKYFYYGLGLMLYDFLSGKFSLGKTGFLSKSEVKARIPELNSDSLKGGIRYYDGQFDDSLICLALARTAINNKATVINHIAAENFIYNESRLIGLSVKDQLTGDYFNLKAKVVINATGVFADEIMQMDNPDHHAIISPSQGIHLVIDKKFYSSDEALLIPETTDGRILFVIPWYNKVLIGTTDRSIPVANAEPIPEQEEIQFVIENFNKYTNHQISTKDIRSVFTGLRPLVNNKSIRSTADLVRDHTIVISNSGLISITGGKWTTYRKMAKDVVNKAIKNADLPFKRCKTKNLKLDLNSDTSENNFSELIHPDFKYTKSDVIHAINHDMACTLEDILARRIRLLFLDVEAALEVAPKVCKWMQTETGKEDSWYISELASFVALAKCYLPQDRL